MGAQTTIYLATSDEVKEVNGAYFKDSKSSGPSKCKHLIKEAKL